MGSALVLSALLLAGSAAATPPPLPSVPVVAPPAAPLAKSPVPDSASAPASPSRSAPAQAAAAGAQKASEASSSPKLPAEPPEDGKAKKLLPVKAAKEPPPRTYAIIPPALSSRALLDELRHTSKDRQAEQTGMAQQTQKLLALQQDIERSRAALREETARLQALIAAGDVRSKDKKEGSRNPDTKTSAKGPQKPDLTPIEGLARTARGMKPDQAAAMMAQLDRGLAATILNHMKPVDAALVLEKMEPATSAALVALLARKDRS